MPTGKLKTIDADVDDRRVLTRLMHLSVMTTAMRLGLDHTDSPTVLALQAAMMVQGGSVIQQECEQDGAILTAAELKRKILVSIQEVRAGLKEAEKLP